MAGNRRSTRRYARKSRPRMSRIPRAPRTIVNVKRSGVLTAFGIASSWSPYDVNPNIGMVITAWAPYNAFNARL